MNMRRICIALVVGMVVSLASGARGQATQPSSATRPAQTPVLGVNTVVHGDVLYGGPDAKLDVMDIYSPAGATGAAVLLFIHGGEWARGDKTEISFKPRFFNEHKIVFASANYRLSPASAHPAQDLESTDPGHVQIQQDHVRHDQRIASFRGSGPEQIVEGCLAVGCDYDLVNDVGFPERHQGHLDIVWVVVDEQDDLAASIHVKLPDFSAGRVQRNVAPWSTALSAHTRPPWRSTIRWTVARPIPVPGNLDCRCRRWNGVKSRSV